MGTKKPKVSGYVSEELKQALLNFSTERGLTESQAVQVILAQHFGIPVELSLKESVEVGGDIIQRILSLESALEALKGEIEAIKGKSKGGSPRELPVDVPSENLSLLTDWQPPDDVKIMETSQQGLSAVDLAPLLGVHKDTLGKWRNKGVLEQKTQEKCGQAWECRDDGKYYRVVD